MELEKNNKILS